MQKITKPVVVKNEEWYLIDATNIRLGILASNVANKILGKDEPKALTFIPNPRYIVIINSDKVSFFPTRARRKLYSRHSGYPGGFRQVTLGDQMEKDSTFVIEHAIKGMLPQNKLRDKYMAQIKIYKADTHPHVAQQPTEIKIS